MKNLLYAILRATSISGIEETLSLSSVRCTTRACAKSPVEDVVSITRRSDRLVGLAMGTMVNGIHSGEPITTWFTIARSAHGFVLKFVLKKLRD